MAFRIWGRKKKIDVSEESYKDRQSVAKVKNHGQPLECEFCKASTETHRVTLRKRIMNNRKVYVCDICSGRGR